MKLTNKEMDEYYTALFSLSEKTTGRLGYGIARNIRKLAEELVEYRALKNKAIVKYGDENSDGNFSILIGTEAYQKFAEEMKELDDISHEIDVFKVDEKDIVNSSLNAKEMLAVDFMINRDAE